MIITFYLPNLNLGGIAQNSIKLAKEFAQNGHEVIFLLHHFSGEYVNVFPSNIRIVDMNDSNIFNILCFIKNFILYNRIDVFISARDFNNSIVLLLKHFYNIDNVHFMATCHTNAIEENRLFKSKFTKLKTYLYMCMASLTYKWADSIVCVSRGVADATSKYTGIPISKIRVIYNPIVEYDFYEKCKENIDEDFWNNPHGEKVIVSVGRLTEQKNFELLIEAFKLVVECNDKIKLYILGEGEKRMQLEQKIQELNLSSYVVLPGYVTNPYKYISNADLFVSSSSWEGFGNSIAEALATGAKIVSTNCPSGPAEILCDGKYGTLVPVNDKHILAKEILAQIFEDKDKNMADMRIKRGLDFTVETIAKQYLNVCEGKC